MKNNFITKYFNNIKTVYQNRSRHSNPDIFIFTVIILTALLFFIIISVFVRPGGTRFCYNFYLEEGSASILSATTLATGSLLAYACFFMKSSASRRQKVFFLLVALALTYMALDEVLQFHENIGLDLDHIRAFRKITHATGARSWNDLIIIIYGIVGLPVLLYFLPTVVEIPYIAEYFIIAFLSYVTHTSIDSFANPPTTVSYIFEESAKLGTSTFLALGLLSGLLFLINSKKKAS